jgi:tyrosyl-tRNA synthetase
MVLGLAVPKNHYESLEEKIMDLKMSKSNPDAAIFMTDTEDQIKKKINKAYCPEGIVEGNPILEYTRYFLFEYKNEIKLERPSKFGGDIQFSSYAEIEVAFIKKEIHPKDLKNVVARGLNELIDPVRKAFDSSSRLSDLREQVMSFTVTR